MDAIELMKKEMLRRNYSLRTIKTYLYSLNKFLLYADKDIKKIKKQDIKDYLDKLTSRNKTGSTINVNLQAIKFLFEEILNKKLTLKIKFSKIPKKLPVFLTKDEIVKLINNIKNEKHNLMIKLIYAAGLRVSELVNLRIKDLEFDNGYGWVRQGKGNKDRIFVIAESLKKELTEYIKKEDLSYDSWLFNSYNGQMSTRTVQEIIKKAAKKSKINKKVHPHTLRHSYATHLIENGYDVTSVQALLGHSSMETTMIYLHIAPKKFIDVKSPLDSLNFNNLQLKNNNEKLSNDDNNLVNISPINQEFEDLRI